MILPGPLLYTLAEKVSAFCPTPLEFWTTSHPSCRCSGDMHIPWARAVGLSIKHGYGDFSCEGADPKRRWLKKTIVRAISYSRSDSGPTWEFSENGTQYSTVVYEINPWTGAERMVSAIGSSSYSSYSRTVNKIGGEDVIEESSDSYSNWIEFTGSGYHWRDDNGIASQPAFSPALVGTLQSRTTTQEIYELRLYTGSGQPPGDVVGSDTITLSEENTSDFSETLRQAAESKLIGVKYAIPYHASRYTITASNGVAPSSLGSDRIPALQSARNAAQAALAAVPANEAMDRLKAQIELEFAELSLELAQANANPDEEQPINYALEINTSYELPILARREEDTWTSSMSGIIRLVYKAPIHWNYIEKPINYRFKWRIAQWANGAAAPTFSDVVDAVRPVQYFDSPHPYKRFAYAISDEITIAPPAAPGMKTITGPPRLWQSSWIHLQAFGYMKMIGFAPYIHSSPPVLYRRETFTGAHTADHGYELIQEDPENIGEIHELYRYDGYDEGKIPEDFPLATLSPCADRVPTADTLPLPPPASVTTTQRRWRIGDQELVAQLSEPWDINEMRDKVNAHVNHPWYFEPGGQENRPPLPDTNASWFYNFDDLIAVRRSCDTSYLLIRSCVRSDFKLGWASIYAPDHEDGRTVTWKWKERRINFDTGAVTESEKTESVTYHGGHLQVEDSNDEDWKKIEPPTTDGMIVWTHPVTDDPWSFGLPTAASVCPES